MSNRDAQVNRQGLLVARVERGSAFGEALDAISHEAFAGPTFSPVAELERAWSRVWAAREEGGAPLGFIVAWHVVDELHVLNVATASAARRRGIGSLLVREALEYARSNGVRLVLLEVRKSNEPAIRLYEKHGFVVTNVRAKYYSDNDEDALEMQLVLSS